MGTECGQRHRCKHREILQCQSVKLQSAEVRFKGSRTETGQAGIPSYCWARQVSESTLCVFWGISQDNSGKRQINIHRVKNVSSYWEKFNLILYQVTLEQE